VRRRRGGSRQAPRRRAVQRPPSLGPERRLGHSRAGSCQLRPSAAQRGDPLDSTQNRAPRLAANPAAAGKRLTVSVIGGSISAGAGSYEEPRDCWVDRLERWLGGEYGPLGVNITVNNGAVPGESLAAAGAALLLAAWKRLSGQRGRPPCTRAHAAPLPKALARGYSGAALIALPPPLPILAAGTTSAFMCACFRRHVPEDADIVFIEYAVNDDERREPLFNNSVRWAEVTAPVYGSTTRGRELQQRMARKPFNACRRRLPTESCVES
jgi:hypothetical protein